MSAGLAPPAASSPPTEASVWAAAWVAVPSSSETAMGEPWGMFWSTASQIRTALERGALPMDSAPSLASSKYLIFLLGRTSHEGHYSGVRAGRVAHRLCREGGRGVGPASFWAG